MLNSDVDVFYASFLLISSILAAVYFLHKKFSLINEDENTNP
jgi:hypothetical protein